MSGASPQAMGGSVIGGVQVPKAIDDFIDELLGMSGMSESKGQRVGSASDGVIWGALLLQARANCTQAEANLQQARANEALSQSLLRSTQSVFDKEVTVDLEPDRLESWYAARGDAAIGCDIAEHVTQQAQNIIGPGEQRGKCAIGSKRRVPSVLELLKGEGRTPAANCKIIDECSGEGGRKPCIIQGFGSSDVVPTSPGMAGGGGPAWDCA